MIDDVVLFIDIVRKGSLVGASHRTGLPTATVSRRLKKLEERLGHQLIHRSARKFTLTAEGEAYFEAYVDLVDQFEAVGQALSRDMAGMSGKLTVAAPTTLGTGLLRPILSDFLFRHPQIRLKLLLSNRMVDLIDDGVELAVRAGPQSDSSLFQKRLGGTASVLTAAPDYLSKHGVPENVGDLERHHLIKMCPGPRWHLTRSDGAESVTVRASPTLELDDLSMGSQLARDGLGIAMMPVSEVEAELEQGRLVRVLPGWQGPLREIFAVWPSGRLLNARARRLLDHLTESVAAEPALQGMVPGGV